MAKTENFDLHTDVYETWFEKNPLVYTDEVQTLKKLIDNRTNGLDIGMGSGRFALPFGIDVGIEPSQKMREIAIARGLHPVDGIAEDLPFENETFDFALMITVICFVDDPLKALKEAYRVIRENGSVIIGMVDRNSLLGQTYQSTKQTSRFYNNATFYAVEEIIEFAKTAGFTHCSSTGVTATDNAFVFVECFKSSQE